MKQRTFLFLLVLLSTLTASAYDAYIDGIYYNLNSSTNKATITFGDNQYTGSVTIPETISYDGVTYSVTEIGDSTFFKCSNMKSVIIPNSVVSIGSRAFFKSGITSIDIPNSVTEIGYYAFGSCHSLTSVTIPNSVTTIKNGTFNYCDALPSVSIPNSVISVGNYAFEKCSALKSIEIPGNVTEIGVCAFEKCSALKSIEIPSNVTEIGTQTFYQCTSLTSVTIGNSVKTIGRSAFWGCSKLTSVAIPNSVTEIGEYAFCKCISMTSLTIGNSLASIKYDAFTYTPSLTSIIVDGGNINYDSRNNCNAIIETSTNTLTIGCKKTTIPNSVTSIGYHAFYGNNALTSVTIPNSIGSIGYEAFSMCPNLTSIIVESGNPNCDSRDNCNAIIWTDDNSIVVGCKNTIISNSVTRIAPDAFKGSGLTTITIPNNVTSIGDDAFQYCDSLASVIIGKGVTSIGVSAFASCPRLYDVYCYAKSVPTTGYGAFESLWNATLHAPETSLEAYKTTEPWSRFGSIVAIDDEPVVEDVAINETNFPDENFRNYILGMSYGKDGRLSAGEIDDITYMSIPYRSNIQSLKGIEYFTALTRLECSYNQLTNLDVSKNTALTYLSCTNNQLQDLDISKNEELSSLSCSRNQLSSLDISNNRKLAYIYCGTNLLTSLDVLENMELEYLDCGNNLFTSIDVSKNTKLTSLYCSENQLTSLDVSKNTALTWLDCKSNQLTSLNLSGCKSLTTLRCEYNKLTSLDVSGCMALTTLQCESNKLTSLDLSKNKELTKLECALNQINGSAMDALVSSLPTVSNGTMQAIFNRYEGNVMTTIQVAAAKAKGWTPYYTTNYGSSWTEYFGSEPEALEKCATPTISYVNDKLEFTCETEGVEFVSKVTCPDPGEYEGSSVTLTKTYTVTVYAKKEGYEDSDVATMVISVGGGEAGVRGDVNLDGEIGMPDVMFIVNYILNGKFPDEE